MVDGSGEGAVSGDGKEGDLAKGEGVKNKMASFWVESEWCYPAEVAFDIQLGRRIKTQDHTTPELDSEHKGISHDPWNF